MSFGDSAPWSLGVEEELFLVDARTLEPAPLFTEVVPEPGERLKPELFACIVEITTPVCGDADGVLDELRRLRHEVASRAAVHGAAIVAAGTHPLAVGAGQPIVPEQRYLDLVAKAGDRVFRQIVCGLHVHVGMPDADTCLRAYEGVVPWLPTLLALSASSPFVEGRPSGMRSSRAGRLDELPSGGPPPVLRSWAEWERATGRDYTRRHWDVRPHPRFGTLEVRIPDQQTDVRRSAAFAALVQALVVSVADEAVEVYDRNLYAERRAAAAAEPPDPGELAQLGELVEPAARRFGSWPVVSELLASPPEAERQLELGLPAALRDLAERSLP
ncbi:MAG TPA: YbdK family carboxylate-amine ligase [Gaiellaceae bacterium]|nr:YbdK family carboxylate-amine ligase [Gaiellaceae bacterium]